MGGSFTPCITVIQPRPFTAGRERSAVNRKRLLSLLPQIVQGTFGERSGNVQGTFSKRPAEARD
jgi:hypothetical protein